MLELISLADKLDHETFTDGVRIIQQAYKPTRSSFFIKAHYLDKLGHKVTIDLSIASVDFPKDFDLTFLLPEKHKQDENT